MINISESLDKEIWFSIHHHTQLNVFKWNKEKAYYVKDFIREKKMWEKKTNYENVVRLAIPGIYYD